jgi:hypothetical protein
MIGNTITITVGVTDKVLTLINQDGYSSEYLLKDTASEFRLRIRHSKTKATAAKPSYDRHNVELVETVYADGDVDEFERKFYFVIEQKPDDLDVGNVDAMADKAIASTNAFLDSLMGWES